MIDWERLDIDRHTPPTNTSGDRTTFELRPGVGQSSDTGWGLSLVRPSDATPRDAETPLVAA